MAEGRVRRGAVTDIKDNQNIQGSCTDNANRAGKGEPPALPVRSPAARHRAAPARTG
ncbi:hypothetical protein ACF1DY_33090 [Streptomyces albus]